MTHTFKVNSISKMTIDSVYMQVFLYALAFSMLSIKGNAVEIKHFWEISKYFLGLGISFWIATFLVGVFFQSARTVHIIFPVTVLFSIAPLLLAVYEINEKSYKEFFIGIALCVINIVLYYRFTLRNLLSKNTLVIKSGRLNVEQGLWDLKKHLLIDEGRDIYKNISNILIPLGAIIGSVLARNSQDFNTIMATCFGLFFSIVISGTIGIHIATSKYITFIEKKYGKNIKIK